MRRKGTQRPAVPEQYRTLLRCVSASRQVGKHSTLTFPHDPRSPKQEILERVPPAADYAPEARALPHSSRD